MHFKYTILLSLAALSSLVSAVPLTPRTTTNKGDVTFFQPGLGACGKTNGPNDLIVAVSSQFFATFGSQSNGNPVCGRKIKATAPNKKSVTVTVVDKCPGCAKFDLDMSPAAFEKLAALSVGRIHNVQWQLL